MHPGFERNTCISAAGSECILNSFTSIFFYCNRTGPRSVYGIIICAVTEHPSSSAILPFGVEPVLQFSGRALNRKIII